MTLISSFSLYVGTLILLRGQVGRVEKLKDGERRKLELVEGIMFYVDVICCCGGDLLASRKNVTARHKHHSFHIGC